jgi:hypothetical protein
MTTSIPQQSPVVELATPVYYPNSLAGSGSQGTAVGGGDADYWRYRSGSAPNLAGMVGAGAGPWGQERGVMDERWMQKTRMPIELPVQSQVQTPRTETREIYPASDGGHGAGHGTGYHRDAGHQGYEGDGEEIGIAIARE